MHYFYQPINSRELSFLNYRIYIWSTFLVLGNVLTPYILHQFNIAGQIFLPIYFFTLIGAYKFGWKTGIIIALFSPTISYLLIGMPAFPVLYFVLIKSFFLALAASFVARRFKKVSILGIGIAILFYQSVGSFLIYLFTYNIHLALLDLKVGYPGLLIQLFGGCLILSLVNSYEKEEF